MSGDIKLGIRRLGLRKVMEFIGLIELIERSKDPAHDFKVNAG